MSKERPILFSGPMVRAILEGRKTQTRRIVKPQPRAEMRPVFELASGKPQKDSPYGKPGDRLWVRETWGVYHSVKSWTDCGYEYDGDFIKGPLQGKTYSRTNTSDREGVNEFVVYRADGVTEDGDTWRPSIHMPRWASRITLEVVSVRVERLQDISNDDAIAEGIDTVWRGDNGPHEFDQVPHFRTLWESINGPGSWDANPWVWCISFNRIMP